MKNVLGGSSCNGLLRFVFNRPRRQAARRCTSFLSILMIKRRPPGCTCPPGGCDYKHAYHTFGSPGNKD